MTDEEYNLTAWTRGMLVRITTQIDKAQETLDELIEFRDAFQKMASRMTFIVDNNTEK